VTLVIDHADISAEMARQVITDPHARYPKADKRVAIRTAV
jgi:hypothetical protein